MLVLGVDGGQTGTRAVITTSAGQVVASAQAGGLIHVLAPNGAKHMAQVLTILRSQLAQSCAGAPDAVYLSLTGVETGTPSQQLAQTVAQQVWPGVSLRVENDGMAAWAGGTGGLPGATAMAGTGSVAVAINESGEQVRTGGWGYMFGDAGGGWDIGAQAVRHMLRRWDQDLSVSPLGQLLLQRLGVQTPPDVARGVYGETIQRVQIAGLAEVVANAARSGDSEASRILARAAAEFAEDVAASLQRLHWEKRPVIVATLGRIFQSGDVYRQPFGETLQRRTPLEVQLVEPALSTLGGAALLALRLGGVTCGPAVLERLARSGLGPQ